MSHVQITCPVCHGSHTIAVTEAQRRGEEPVNFLCPDLDRRYRLAGSYVDTRRRVYCLPGFEDYGAKLIDQLKFELGPSDFERKFDRWKKIDYPSLGLIDEYLDKIHQIINAYCVGYSYPAVTASCCLAERVLNRLVLMTREHFRSHPQYKRIHRKESFDDWERMLSLILEWKLVPHRAIELFRDLMPIRHQSIHYRAEHDFEAVAHIVINKLIAAITEVFGVTNREDIYLVFDVPGEVWVRSAAERLPFVKEFVLPHCYYAHAVHDVDLENKKIIERLGKTGPLTDEEFVELRKGSL